MGRVAFLRRLDNPVPAHDGDAAAERVTSDAVRWVALLTRPRHSVPAHGSVAAGGVTGDAVRWVALFEALNFAVPAHNDRTSFAARLAARRFALLTRLHSAVPARWSEFSAVSATVDTVWWIALLVAADLRVATNDELTIVVAAFLVRRIAAFSGLDDAVATLIAQDLTIRVAVPVVRRIAFFAFAHDAIATFASVGAHHVQKFGVPARRSRRRTESEPDRSDSRAAILSPAIIWDIETSLGGRPKISNLISARALGESFQKDRLAAPNIYDCGAREDGGDHRAPFFASSEWKLSSWGPLAEERHENASQIPSLEVHFGASGAGNTPIGGRPEREQVLSFANGVECGLHCERPGQYWHEGDAGFGAPFTAKLCPNRRDSRGIAQFDLDGEFGGACGFLVDAAADQAGTER